MGLLKLIIGFTFLCLCSMSLFRVQGYSCVSSCQGITNGDYQSCFGCNLYATCSNGYIYDNRSCAADLVWDDNLKRCNYTSATCPGDTTEETPCTTSTSCPNCCVEGELNVNLTSDTGEVTGYLPGVGIVSNISEPVGSEECSRSIVFSADFDRITNNDSCDVAECFTTPPFCSQRLLKAELYLSNIKRQGRLFNIGDSSGNNGGGGDDSTQQNDAEIDGIFPDAFVYTSDKHGPFLGNRFSANDITRIEEVDKVTLYIGNHFFRMVTNTGDEFSVCHRFLFALNGQSDSSPGGINERVFIGINTVVKRSSGRLGVGVCGARLTWACGFE